MHWFYKMLWEVQILILLLIQGQVVLINYKALCIYTLRECSKCWITNGGEVCKVLLPSVSRQSKSLMCAWLGIIQSTRFSESYKSAEKQGFENLCKLLLLHTSDHLRDLSQMSKYYTIFTFWYGFYLVQCIDR